MLDLEIQDVRERLSLTPRWMQWLERIDIQGPADPVPFPSDADAAVLLDHLGVVAPDRIAVIASRPDPRPRLSTFQFRRDTLPAWHHMG